MTKNRSSKKLSWQLCKPVIASALAIGGVFNLVGVVLAEGTAAGTQISNTATATYRDPEGTPQTSTSNTVVVEVAEIAGITVVNNGAAKYDPEANEGKGGVVSGTVEPGDQIAYTFEITNVGNDETDISLPAVANFTGPVDSLLSIKADLDNDGTYETDITNRTDIENIGTDESFSVQVIVQTSTSAQDDDIVTVQYGDTPGDGQNQPYDSSGGSVFTDDNDADDENNIGDSSQTGEEAGPDAPANGEREASDTGRITIGEEPLEQPLVELKKSINSYSDSDTTTDPTDDTIVYDLTFDVLDDDDVPIGSTSVAADLQSITINGLGTKHILISDAVPEGTVVESMKAPTLTPSEGGAWKAVYTTDPIDSTDPITSAVEASWQEGPAPANATRVGFISAENAVIPKGTTVGTAGDFQITLSIDADNVPTTVANIAQVFGSGAADDPLTPEDETVKFPVMDESGDETPSNYNPDTDTYSNFNPDVVDNSGPNELPDGFTPDDGYIEDPSDLLEKGVDPGSDTPNDPGDDNGGDNTDGDGEAIVITLIEEPEPNIFNGPDGAPDAIGPTGTNDDFTNKSAPFSDGDPPVVAFTNTVANNNTTPNPSEDGWVTLKPIAPEESEDLPAGTTATIIAPDGTRVVYTYDPTGNENRGEWTTTDDPIIVPIRADDDAPGGDDEFDYGVEVDLFDDDSITELDSYPVPIEATFVGVSTVDAVDSDPNDTIEDADITAALAVSETTNVTIDRVYTGFLELVKTAQVVQGDGPPVTGNPAPGNHIKYRVEYRNISEPEIAPMEGNVLLTASDLVIIEDGTEIACPTGGSTSPDPANPDATANNWAYDNDGNGELDTRHVISSVDLTNLDDGSAGSVLFFSGGPEADCDPAFNPDTATPTTELSGTTYNTDTTKYAFDIEGDIEPLESGYVEFERRVNDSDEETGTLPTP